MDWAKDGTGNRNPIVSIDGDEGLEILTRTPHSGTTVTLDASKSFDSDGDELTFRWWVLYAAGTWNDEINLTNKDSSIAAVAVPAGAAGKTFHVICEVTDNGTHNLVGYRRIIFQPTK